MSAGNRSYRIAVDCMGGDKGPAEVVSAVRLALRELGEADKVVLFGRETELQPLLDKAGLAGTARIELRHCGEVIAMDDNPMQALKQKKDSSMLRALDALKAGEVDAVVSCGNTKVLVGAGLLKLRAIAGAERTALTTIWPRRQGHFIMLDAGANPEATPGHLVHNAVLGSLYAKATLGIAKPRVGLLTVGTEEGKGGDRINKTHTMLKALGDSIHYVGPVEGYDLFEDAVDVVVTDGFTGNVVLKTSEGIFHMVQHMIKERVKRNPFYLLGGLMLVPMLKSLKSHLKPESYGGAPLLGLSGLVMKSHGSASAPAIASAIRLGRQALEADLLESMKAGLIVANERIRESHAHHTKPSV
jgi:glycerol-3-phosphate acyltransferase PlsX